MRIHSHGDLVAAAGLGGRGNASHQVLALVGQVQIDLSAHQLRNFNLSIDTGDCRLPLVAPSAAVQAQLETAMQEFGLLK